MEPLTSILALLGALFLAVLAKLLADEVKAWCPWLTEHLIKIALRRSPEHLRDRLAEEWRSHINEIPGDLGKIWCALDFTRGAGKLPTKLKFELPLGGMTKRRFDIIVSLVAIIALAPIFVLISLAIKATDGGPIFYHHRRIGMNRQTFKCLKFRTTRVPGGSEISNRKMRPSMIGQFLRKTSLDELPQILNILVGDMSVVGTRPLVEEEMKQYGEENSDFFKARPGLTGPWQVTYRTLNDWQDRKRHDLGYVKNWSFLKDIAIIARTIPAVLIDRSIHSRSSHTARAKYRLLRRKLRRNNRH